MICVTYITSLYLGQNFWKLAELPILLQKLPFLALYLVSNSHSCESTFKKNDWMIGLVVTQIFDKLAPEALPKLIIRNDIDKIPVKEKFSFRMIYA